MAHLPLPMMIKARDPVLLAHDATCGAALATRVERAVAHEDSCSFYELGRGHPEPTMSPWHDRIAQFLSLHIRELARTDLDRALWLALDGVRLFRDLTRGKTSASAAIEATGSEGVMLETIGALLQTARPRDPAAMLEAVDALLDEERPANDSFEPVFRALEADMKPPRDLGITDRRVERALVQLVVEDTIARRDAACPGAATFRECRDGLVAYDAAVQTPVTLEGRAALVERVRIAWHRPHYPEFRAEPIVALTALRLHLAILARKACPPAIVLAADPHANPPRLGPVAITGTRTARIIGAPAWMTREMARWTIRCR